MARRTQALVGIGLLLAGVLCAYAGSVGANRGVDWLAEGAAFPAGLLFALAVVFLLRAALTGPARNWAYFASTPHADGAPNADSTPRPDGHPKRRDEPRSAQTLEIIGPDEPRPTDRDSS